jgi:hypothetical protein
MGSPQPGADVAGGLLAVADGDGDGPLGPPSAPAWPPAASWQASLASAATTYGGILLGMILLGVGAGLTIPSATESVMGSLPGGHTGVGSATNGAFLQVDGALGVAGRVGGVLGTELAHLARSAFVSGMDIGLATGACVAAAGCLIALLALPSRSDAADDEAEPR